MRHQNPPHQGHIKTEWWSIPNSPRPPVLSFHSPVSLALPTLTTASDCPAIHPLQFSFVRGDLELRARDSPSVCASKDSPNWNSRHASVDISKMPRSRVWRGLLFIIAIHLLLLGACNCVGSIQGSSPELLLFRVHYYPERVFSCWFSYLVDKVPRLPQLLSPLHCKRHP